MGRYDNIFNRLYNEDLPESERRRASFVASEAQSYKENAPITLGLNGGTYHFQNVDVAYQALKCPEKMYEFTGLNRFEAEKLGSKVPLRKDWNDIKKDLKAFLMKVARSESRSANIGRFCKDFVEAVEKAKAEQKESGDILVRPLTQAKAAHSVSVARYMMDNAFYWGVEPDEAYTIGLLHDVGYIYGRRGHEASGSVLLERMGLYGTYTEAILYHGTDPYSKPVRDALEDNPNLKVMLTLLYDADMSIDAGGRLVGHKGRLEDIKLRYGEDHIAYRTASAEVRFVEEQAAAMKKKVEQVYKDLDNAPFDNDGILTEDWRMFKAGTDVDSLFDFCEHFDGKNRQKDKSKNQKDIEK